jgi:hypothetical protein
MSNFSFIPTNWICVFRAAKETVYVQKTYETPTVIIEQIQTFYKVCAALLKQFKTMLA